jgi:hypothetical protein
MDARLRQRRQLERELKAALRREGELALHYQPAFDLAERRLVGFEALVRWNHRRRGPSRPATSSRWPRRPASSSRWAPGSCARRAATRVAGRER